MRRDLDLVRDILITVEGADQPVDDTVLCRDGRTLAEVAFHVELLRERGLANGSVRYDGLAGFPVSVEVSGLTWEGYDYLDAIRSNKVWKKAKDAIADSVGDTSLSVVKQACTMVATGMIKAHLGM